MPLIVVSALFVLAGLAIGIAQPAERGMALATVLFFGGCLVVGLLKRGLVTSPRVMGVASILMGLGAGVMAWLAQDGREGLWPTPWVLVMGVAGLLFFGGGGLMLLIRNGRPFRNRFTEPGAPGTGGVPPAPER